jgi:uncharacterized membrane protein
MNNMDASGIVSLLQESLFLIIVFICFFVYAFTKGRQSVTNLILGLYFALLISIEFPFYDSLLGGTSNPKTASILMLIVFGIFTFIATILFARLMPREYDEKPHEGLGRKFLLALGATILVMAFSYHALPVTDFITPGSPINFLFGSEQSFFWWLMAPIAILFFV